ncbi:MAG TPA: amidase family protein [Chloroflexota bacterium]|nr:amidase family protein [Chloroflexota bacterium]
MFHLLEASIDDIHTAMRAREVSSRQLVELYVNRIEAYDHKGPGLTAVQTVNERALDEAERLDQRFAATGPVGPLHGIPVLVKDQVETVDMPTTYGSALFRGFLSGRNATAVERLRAAGALILAKTTMGEFASGYCGSAFGVCRNPYDPEREPGGSSCGSGVGVAANFGVAAIGEDTFGSIRNPAARNSLVGLRPTVPLVSRFGMMPATPTQDTLGPIARTVRDTALLLDALAGYDPRDPVTAACVGHVPPTYTSFLDAEGLRGARLGVIREPVSDDTDPATEDFAQVRAVLDRALGELAAGGAEIVDPLTIPDLRDLVRRSAGSFEGEAAIDGYLATHPNAPVKSVREILLSPEVVPSRRARMLEDVGHTTSDPGYLQQQLARTALRQAVLVAMADHGLDALVYASLDHVPERIAPDVLTTTRRVTSRGANRALASYMGYPALTVPAGFVPAGLPVGLELLGRPFTEGTLLKLAYGYEQRTRHRQPPASAPPLPGEP